MPNKQQTTSELIKGIQLYKKQRKPVLPPKTTARENVKMLIEGAIDRLQDGLYEKSISPAIQEAIVLLLAADSEDNPGPPMELL